MANRDVPPRLVIGVISGGIVFIVAVMLIMSESGVFQITGMVVVVAFLVFAFASDWFDARTNERHVEKHPELLRNDAIGEHVVASGAFEMADDAATGYVILNGEQWKASCASGYLPKHGDVLSVHGREGLTLFVRLHGDDA